MIQDKEKLTINHTDLRGLISKILEKVGVPPEDAATTADVMVTSDLRGEESHGARSLDIYLKRIVGGGMKPVTNLRVVKEKEGFLLLDAQAGIGQVALSKAIKMGITKARIAGICVVAVRNSSHCGALAYYSELATEANMAAMVMTNSNPVMAPWGGLTPCLGSNPISFGFPTQGDPVVLDMATTISARGKVWVALQKGDKLPEGIALNKEGQPTTDPKEALEGVMLPVGGPKGYGLAMVIDIMAGIITGSAFGQDIIPIHYDMESAQNIGHFALIINVGDFLPLDDYFARMQRSRQEVKGSKLAEGFTQIFMPGEIEANALKKRSEQGIILPVTTWNMLQEWAERLNV